MFTSAYHKTYCKKYVFKCCHNPLLHKLNDDMLLNLMPHLGMISKY